MPALEQAPALPGDVCAPIIRLMLRASQLPETQWAGLLTSVHALMPERLAEANGRIPLEHSLALAEALMQQSPAGSALGLAMGAGLRDSDLGLPGLVARTAPTLGDALHAFLHFSPLLTRCYLVQPRLLPGSMASLRFQSPALPAQQVFLTEIVLSVCARLIEILSGRQDALTGILCEGGSAPRRQALERQLGATVIASSAGSALLLSNEALNWPVVTAEAGLHDQLRKFAEQQLNLLERHDTISGHVQQWLASRLRGQTPSLEDVADAMGLAAWTLRRRLQAESITFRELLDKMRFQMAQEYLQDSRISLGEIAYALGFSSPAAFQRAFKRWSGQTPGRYREQCAGHAKATA